MPDECLSGQGVGADMAASSASARTGWACTDDVTVHQRSVRAPFPTHSRVRPLQVGPPRRRRWLRRALTTVALLVLALVVALVVVVRSLDRPWLKRRLQAMAHDADRARRRLDGDARGAVLGAARRAAGGADAAGAARVAPELLRVDGLALAWTARSLVAGTPRFGALRVESLALTLVRDAAGRTSLTTIEPHGSDRGRRRRCRRRARRPTRSTGPPPIARIDVARATVTVIAETPDRPRERLRVEGLALHARLAGEGRGFALAATLGDGAAPLVVDVTRTRDGVAAGDARAHLAAQIAASPTAASARIDLDVERQTLSPSTRVEKAAHVEVSARFGDGRVRIEARRTRLGDGAATLEGEAELPDAGPPRIERADGEIDLPRLLALVPSSLVPIEAERARLRYHVAGGSGTVEGELGRVRVTQPGGVIVADGGQLSVRVAPGRDGTTVHVVAPLKSLALPGFAADALSATVDARIAADYVTTGDVGVRFAAARVTGATRMSVRDGAVSAARREAARRPRAADRVARPGDAERAGRVGRRRARRHARRR